MCCSGEILQEYCTWCDNDNWIHVSWSLSSTCSPFMPLQHTPSRDGLDGLVAFKVDFYCRVILYACWRTWNFSTLVKGNLMRDLTCVHFAFTNFQLCGFFPRLVLYRPWTDVEIASFFQNVDIFFTPSAFTCESMEFLDFFTKHSSCMWMPFCFKGAVKMGKLFRRRTAGYREKSKIALSQLCDQSAS